MKNGNEPKQAHEKTKPKQQEGEEFGSVPGAQRDGNRLGERSDTPRGSEPETRAASGIRT